MSCPAAQLIAGNFKLHGIGSVEPPEIYRRPDNVHEVFKFCVVRHHESVRRQLYAMRIVHAQKIGVGKLVIFDKNCVFSDFVVPHEL